MNIEDYLAEEERLKLEFDISLHTLQQRFIGKNKIHFKYTGNHVIKYIDVSHIKSNFSDIRIKISNDFNCPNCSSSNSCLIGQTIINFTGDNLEWKELHICGDCKQKYIINNGM